MVTIQRLGHQQAGCGTWPLVSWGPTSTQSSSWPPVARCDGSRSDPRVMATLYLMAWARCRVAQYLDTDRHTGDLHTSSYTCRRCVLVLFSFCQFSHLSKLKTLFCEPASPGWECPHKPPRCTALAVTSSRCDLEMSDCPMWCLMHAGGDKNYLRPRKMPNYSPLAPAVCADSGGAPPCMVNVIVRCLNTTLNKHKHDPTFTACR